ncbi:universal stress protein [Tepidamorphus sp. 3E244]|uniref:universal stress protein n=1 Tax=Tepidamorphus sp. 3E244 TaxID=3385498 RepID=UPI0038FCC115
MYQRILLPIDLAQDSSWTKAAPVAVALAESSSAELHVMTVIPDMGMSIVGSYMPKEAEAQAIEDAKVRLKAFLDENAPDNLVVKGHVAKGTVYQEIIKAAEALGCDLIVIASHRPELQDYLLGPNAARVVRHATQSVHVVRN